MTGKESSFLLNVKMKETLLDTANRRIESPLTYSYIQKKIAKTKLPFWLCFAIRPVKLTAARSLTGVVAETSITSSSEEAGSDGAKGPGISDSVLGPGIVKWKFTLLLEIKDTI